MTDTMIPPVDVIETAESYTLHADLPGVVAEQVDISYESGELTLSASRTPHRPGGEAPKFLRTFRLTEQVAPDRISADLKHGVLTLTVPKAEAAKPRKIAVR
jgi:HSP20 family protein